MEPLYQPQGVEERWQRIWEEERLYHAEADDPRPTYVIAVPPPNVTGVLHMGHALNGTLQDALAAGSTEGARVLAREHVLASFKLLETILEQVGAGWRSTSGV